MRTLFSGHAPPTHTFSGRAPSPSPPRVSGRFFSSIREWKSQYAATPSCGATSTYIAAASGEVEVRRNTVMRYKQYITCSCEWRMRRNTVMV